MGQLHSIWKREPEKVCEDVIARLTRIEPWAGFLLIILIISILELATPFCGLLASIAMSIGSVVL